MKFLYWGEFKDDQNPLKKLFENLKKSMMPKKHL